jgi:hypothetical protein
MSSYSGHFNDISIISRCCKVERTFSAGGIYLGWEHNLIPYALSFRHEAMRNSYHFGLLVLCLLSPLPLHAQQTLAQAESNLGSSPVFEMDDDRQLPEWLFEVLNVSSFGYLPMGFRTAGLPEDVEYAVFANSEQLDCMSTVCESTLVEFRDNKVSQFLSFPKALDDVSSVFLDDDADVCVSGDAFRYCLSSSAVED